MTIRLSKAECARLRERAAEAGLTVSAYLRSCALEAEALRAEVKQALAELKAGAKPPSKHRPLSGDPGREQANQAAKLPEVPAGQAAPAGKKKPGWRRFFGWIVPITGRG